MCTLKLPCGAGQQGKPGTLLVGQVYCCVLLLVLGRQPESGLVISIRKTTITALANKMDLACATLMSLKGVPGHLR